jgi:hypothetical protein
MIVLTFNKANTDNDKYKFTSVDNSAPVQVPSEAIS